MLLKVLTINIWNRQGPWDDRAALLRAGIDALDPDIIGMQEVLSDGTTALSTDVLKGTDYHHTFGLAKEMAGGVQFGNSAHSRWPIRRSDAVPLPSAGTKEYRSLLVTELDTPAGTLPFLVTHLNWKFHHGFAREAQAVAISNIIRDRYPVSGAALPPIVVGDFNARPDATEIRYLTGLHAIGGKSFYLADCFDCVGAGPGHTFDSAGNPHAAMTREPPRRIDYIFVRGPDSQGRGLAKNCRVVLDDVKGDVAPSDHYGVYAEIEY